MYLAGADSSEMEEELFDNDEASVGTGFFKYKGIEKQEQFLPKSVNLESMWFTGRQSQKYVDCVIHAINNAVGCAYI
jgi:hypothetical protein